MARARNIKPSIMDNEELAELDPIARLLFIYLWMLADREGRLEDRPKRIAKQALAYDNVDIDDLLGGLQSAGFICRYSVDGVACIQINAFAKHQTPHVREAASALPAPPAESEKTAQHVDQGKSEHNQGSAEHSQGNAEPSPRSPDSGFSDTGFSDSLNPDSGYLIGVAHDVLEPPEWFDSHHSASPSRAPRTPVPLTDRKTARPARQAAAKQPDDSKSSAIWDAYAAAYRSRYGMDPLRNGKINSQMKQFASLVPADEAPHIAEFYVRHNKRFYVETGHKVGTLLTDAEKLRMEWASGRQITSTQAAMIDRTQTNANAFSGLLAEARAAGGAK